MKAKVLRLASVSNYWFDQNHQTKVSGRVDKAPVTETVNTGSIPGWVKSKAIKVSVCNFRANV